MNAFEHSLRNAQRNVPSLVAWTPFSDHKDARLILEKSTNLISAQIPHPSGTPSSQAVDRSGTAPPSPRGQLNNTPYILRSLKKRKCTEKSWYQNIFLRKRGWTPACPLLSEATRASHGPDEIKKYAFVVVLQIGQVVGEVGEVVADAGLQVLANTTIDRGQCAAAPLIYIRQVKRSHLRQAIPFLEEPPVHAQHRELRGVVEKIRVHAIQTFLSHAVRVLASEGPIRREVVVQIERRDVALLKELGRGVLQSHLTRGRHVIKVRVLDQRVQPVVPHRTVCVADHRLGVAAGIELAERAITDRVVQLADQAPVGRQLQLEIIAKQPCSHFLMCLVELFRVIPAKLDRARELQLSQAVAHVDPCRLAIGLGAGL